MRDIVGVGNNNVAPIEDEDAGKGVASPHLRHEPLLASDEQRAALAVDANSGHKRAVGGYGGVGDGGEVTSNKRRSDALARVRHCGHVRGANSIAIIVICARATIDSAGPRKGVFTPAGEGRGVGAASARDREHFCVCLFVCWR